MYKSLRFEVLMAAAMEDDLSHCLADKLLTICKITWHHFSFISFNSFYSVLEHGASMKHLQRTLFPARLLTSLQVFPAPRASSSTVLRQVVLGLPLLHFPWGFLVQCLSIYRTLIFTHSVSYPFPFPSFYCCGYWFFLG
jgi:hypothetical protein